MSTTGSHALSYQTTRPGAEPGINPRRIYSAAQLGYGVFKQECVIEVADYDADNASLRRMGNSELIDLLNEPSPKQEDPLTASNRSSTQFGVRWIDIGGLDWNLISAVALKYNLHSLALEDVLHEQGHNHSKADYYHEHLFIRILCHTLERDDDAIGVHHVSSHIPDTRTEYPGSWLELGKGKLEKIEKSRTHTHFERPPAVPLGHGHAASPHYEPLQRTMSMGLTGFFGAARKRQIMRLRALTKGDRVNVHHEPLSIFLLPNGTVITMHPKADLEFTAPIRDRLLNPDSVLRTSEDASLLVQGLLDLVVDRVLEIMDEYQDKIHLVEQDVLLRPGLDTLRTLHILSGDLIMHKRTLDPIKVLIYGLRHHDLDRCVALANHAEAEAGLALLSGAPGAPKKQQVHGYLSYKTKLYLADVSDHMDFVLTSLDMFAGLAENLINFAFNVCVNHVIVSSVTKELPKTASYEMNQVMRRLTLATIIFLPLTLLVGYFGMNFEDFHSIRGSVTLFWKLAIPVVAALIPIFMLTDLQRIVHNLRKRIAANRMVKMNSPQRR